MIVGINIDCLHGREASKRLIHPFPASHHTVQPGTFSCRPWRFLQTQAMRRPIFGMKAQLPNCMCESPSWSCVMAALLSLVIYHLCASNVLQRLYDTTADCKDKRNKILCGKHDPSVGEDKEIVGRRVLVPRLSLHAAEASGRRVILTFFSVCQRAEQGI